MKFFLPLLPALVLTSTVAHAAEPAQAPTPQPGVTVPERSMFAYLQRQLEKGPRLQIPDDAKAVPAWREEVARRLPEMLGLDLSVPVPLAPRLIGTRQREGYRIEHVAFWSEAGVEIPAYVLIPDGASAEHPVPAVLCLQGLVPGGKDELAGEVENNPAAAAGLARYHDDFARQFVRAGVVALAFDMRFDGERTWHGEPDPFGLNTRVPAMALATKYATMTGQTFFGLHLFDARRALDYLETRPEVQKQALGCAGFSFGSALGAWLAAMDRRVKAVALEGNVPSWRRLALRDLQDRQGQGKGPGGKPYHWMVSATFHAMPGFLREMDLNLSTAAVAPTPLLLSHESEAGWIYADQAEAERDLAPVRQAYAAFNATESLRIVHVEGGHHWRPEVIVPWICGQLRTAAKAVR
ncbi:MAG: alpha/beta hydrolase family protein [Prosthecobacter sp.]